MEMNSNSNFQLLLRSCSRHHQHPLQQVLAPSILRFSQSSSSSSWSTASNFHKPPISLNHQSVSLLRSSRTIRCLPHDAASGSAVKVVDTDPGPSLALKKKATEISPDLRGTSIFLVGLNSAKKSSLGKLLADVLRYYYFDSDSLVREAAADTSFEERAEDVFCESETEVLKQLSSMGRLVVCAGNGAVKSATNLALLRHGISIWINVPLDMVVADGSGSYTEDLTRVSALYEEMRGGYAIADVTVSLQNVACQLGYDDFDAVTTEDMTLEVLKEIEKLTRVKKMLEEAARPF